MKIAQLTEIGKIEVVDGATPQVVSPKDVQVQVKAVGICGTDLHIFAHGRADVTYPRIMGHELSGVVTEVGSDVTRVKVGDRVVLDPVFACGTCPTCQKGYPNVCDSVKCYGVQMDGGYQEYIVVEDHHLYTFSDNITFEQAALAEPFSIASNICERLQVKEGDNVVILGAGTIGLSIVQAAKSLGARILVSDIVDSKLAKATDFGAEVVVNSKTANLKEAVEAFSPGGSDVIIDAVGVTALFVQSFDYAAPRARVASIGFDANPAELLPIMITKKELSIIGSRMNCFQFPTVMKWLEEGKIEADKMISKKYSIDDIQQAFVESTTPRADVTKVLICFWYVKIITEAVARGFPLRQLLFVYLFLLFS